MSCKHVALLIPHFQKKGGLEKHALKIAEAFLNQGVNLSLLTQTASSSVVNSLLKIYSFPPSFFCSFDRQVQQWLALHSIDISFGMGHNRVQTHLRVGNGVHAAYLRKYPPAKQLLYRFHPRHRRLLQIEKAAFQYPHLQVIFANSHMVRRELCEHYSVDPSKIEVIHNGVEWDEMKKDFDDWPQMKKETSTQWGIEPSLFQFLFVGNGYRRKGLELLLRALATLKRRDFFLSIVGKDSNWKFYARLAKALGLSSHICFFGPQRSLIPFYQLADVVVIPSLYDPFANVTVEALAMGVFALSSSSNGGAEILTKQTGRVVKDVFSLEELTYSLELAMNHPKTQKRATLIRDQIQPLNFPSQLDRLIRKCL